MSARITAALLVASSAIGCGLEPAPIEVEPAEFAELCGEAGPVQILRFEPWRSVLFAYHWASFGDRRLIGVNYQDTRVGGQTLWSVGPCGEQPRRLMSGHFSILTLPPYDGPFVCDEQSPGVQVIDLTGERPPKLVFEMPSATCWPTHVDAGLVGIWPDAPDSETGSLMLQPWPADPWTDEVEGVVLLDDVQTHHSSPGVFEWHALQGGEDELFVVNAEHQLVRVAVANGSVEVIADGVRTFDVSRETADSAGGHPRRYLLWQRVEPSNDDPEAPEGEIVLLDRATNETASLGHAGLRSDSLNPLSWTESGVVLLRVRVDGELVLRLFSLPSLEFIDVDATIEPRGMLADDRHLVVEVGEDGPIGTLDIQTGELWTHSGSPISSYWWESRTLTLLTDDGELLLTDGGPPELIARRATHSHEFMPDGRVLSGIDIDRFGAGDLIVIDPETFEERLVDRGIMATFFSVATEEQGDLVIYTVLEDDRSGVWMARLQPRE